jgi:hypothetical protein
MTGDRRYKCMVCESLGTAGIVVYVDSGTLKNVYTLDGDREYIAVGDRLQPATGWHETEDAAIKAAAAQVLEIAGRIAAQALRMQRGEL